MNYWVNGFEEHGWRKDADFGFDKEDHEPLVCPNCGSHTIRSVNVLQNVATLRCLTCDTEFEREVMPNPQAKVGMRPYDTPTALDRLFSAVIKRIGFQRVSLAQNDAIYSFVDQEVRRRALDQTLPRLNPSQLDALASDLAAQWVEEGGDDPIAGMVPEGDVTLGDLGFTPGAEEWYRGAGMQKHAPGKEHVKEWSRKRNRQYEHILESCREEHPNWSLERCKELAARTVNKTRSEKGETKSSVDKDCGCDESVEKEAAEEGKHRPGTRVQVKHPKYKGQRGTVVEFKGRHKDLDEEQYEVLLDSGERVGELNESNFDRIKSAHVGNENLPDTAGHYFLGSMEFTAEAPEHPTSDNDTKHPYDPDPRDFRDTEEPDFVDDVICPICQGNAKSQGALGPREHFRCSNCGMEFSIVNRADIERWNENDPDKFFGQDGPQFLGKVATDLKKHPMYQMGFQDGYEGNPPEYQFLGPAMPYQGGPTRSEEDKEIYDIGFRDGAAFRRAEEAPDYIRGASKIAQGDPRLDPEAIGYEVPYPSASPGFDPAGAWEEEEEEFAVAKCPVCSGPGMFLGPMGTKAYFRCRDCGMDFYRDEDPAPVPPAQEPDPSLVPPNREIDPSFIPPQYPPDPSLVPPGQAMASISKWQDSTGKPLSPGAWYKMHHKDYKVPDVIRILNLEDNRIEAAIASDHKGAFPIVIESAEEYSFEPHEEEHRYEIETQSGWKIARRSFSPKEQKELIDEGKDEGAVARNFSKLDLTGTHYELRESASDPNFLWS